MGRAIDSRRAGVGDGEVPKKAAAEGDGADGLRGLRGEFSFDASRISDTRSGRQVAWRFFARLLAARWTRTVEAESARVRPVLFVVSGSISLDSGKEALEWRFPRPSRLPLRMAPINELRFSNGTGPGDPGGVETGEPNVEDLAGEY